MTRERRELVLRCAVGSALGVALASATEAQSRGTTATETRQRDVLLITLDTTRRDSMGFLGRQPSPTPVLDALAAQSVVFTDAVTVAPLTLPAHTSLMTGLYPGSHGVHDNSLYRVPAEVHTLAELLHEAGYATGAAVAAFVLDPVFGLDQGFDHYFSPPRAVTSARTLHFDELRATPMVDRALADLAELAKATATTKPAAADGRPPFFYWLHLFDPHNPYDPQPTPQLTATVDLAALNHALYEAEIRSMDEQLGRLFGDLRERGLLDRMVVVVAADHGESLGDALETTHGHFLFDATIRVPLLIRDLELPHAKVELTTSLVDVAPTLLARLGVDARGEHFDGRDLSPWMADPTLAPPDRVVPIESWYVWLNYGFAPFEGCIAGPLKYLHSAREQLFDRATDPQEKKNLFASDDPRALGLARRLAAEQAAAHPLAHESPGLSDADRAALAALGYAQGGVNASRPGGDWSTLPDAYGKLAAFAGFDAVSTAIERGEYDHSIELLRTLTHDEPQSALFHEQLGMMLINLATANESEAAHELQRALELDPRRGRTWFALARCLDVERTQAKEQAKAARDRGEGKEGKRLAAAERALAARVEQAVRESLRQEPTYPDALLFLGQHLAEEADRAVRAKESARALELFAEVEAIVTRFLAVVPADAPEAKAAAIVRARAQAKRAELSK